MDGSPNGRAQCRILRVIKCLRLLEGACYSPEDLARHFGVSKRTIYRDLRVLARAEVPLARQAGDSRYHVPAAWPAATPAAAEAARRKTQAGPGRR